MRQSCVLAKPTITSSCCMFPATRWQCVPSHATASVDSAEQQQHQSRHLLCSKYLIRATVTHSPENQSIFAGSHSNSVMLCSCDLVWSFHFQGESAELLCRQAETLSTEHANGFGISSCTKVLAFGAHSSSCEQQCQDGRGSNVNPYGVDQGYGTG